MKALSKTGYRWHFKNDKCC